MTGPVVVIGVGNEWRGDDGAGIVAVRHVRARAGDGVVTIELDGEPARIVEVWDGAALAVVIDAVRTGHPPGTVRVVDPAALAAPDGAGRSSHGAGVGEAHRLGQALGRLPERLAIVGIEVADTEIGATLGATVAQGARRAADEALSIVGGANPAGPTADQRP